LSVCLALDAAPAAPTAALIDDSQGLVLDRFTLVAGLDALAVWPDRIVHRWPHAPVGSAEVSEPLEPDVLSAAGALEPADTAARLAVLAAALQRWPTVRQQLVFDTPWFDALPEIARHYGLPPATEAELGLRRVGRHGPVHRLATARCPGRCVASLFLGYESSAAAVVAGAPVETSAGATGLEGLPGSRTCGDVDPAALLYLMDNLGESREQVAAAAGLHGGWSGLAGVATLAELRAAETAAAHDALALLIDRCRRVIGAWAAVMNGLDAIVLSGDAEHLDPLLADEIAAGLAYLGVPDRVPVRCTELTPTLAAALVSV